MESRIPEEGGGGGEGEVDGGRKKEERKQYFLKVYAEIQSLKSNIVQPEAVPGSFGTPLLQQLNNTCWFWPKMVFFCLSKGV